MNRIDGVIERIKPQVDNFQDVRLSLEDVETLITSLNKCKAALENQVVNHENQCKICDHNDKIARATLNEVFVEGE